MDEGFNDAVEKVWGAWFGNVTEGLFWAPVAQRLRFINNCLRPMMSYKWSKWPRSENTAKRVDQLHRHLVATSLRLPMLPGENAEAYHLRKHRASARLRIRWANRVASLRTSGSLCHH